MAGSSSIWIARLSAAFAVVAGVWLIFSPWIWLSHYADAAKWNDFGIGILVLFLMSLKALFPRIGWISWVGIFIGLWVLFSPWALEYAVDAGALRNNVLTATVIIMASSIAAIATLAVPRNSA